MTCMLRCRPPKGRQHPKNCHGSGIAHLSAILLRQERLCGALSKIQTLPNAPPKPTRYPPRENIKLAGCPKICAPPLRDLSSMTTKMMTYGAPTTTLGIDKPSVGGVWKHRLARV